MSGPPGRMAAIALVCALLAAGCASAIALTAPKAGEELSCVRPASDTDLLLGVALSGGGSRAALFAAAGLEALGRVRLPGGGSLLEQVGYVSSVSGGSVAGAYYASHKPPHEISVLTPEGALSGDYQVFFKQFREVVTQDLEGALVRRQLSTFRWLNSALAARSLREVLTERVLGPIRFEELAEREARGDSPRLLVNTTLFNNGRRLVFTTLPPAALQYEFFPDLQRSLARRGLPTEIAPDLAVRWEALLPVVPQDLHLDVCAVPLAGAVAGSASFPPLVGPITFRVGEEELYWHTGDGGLYENQGVESILFAFLKRLQERKARRALIIAVDSSYPFSVGSRRLTLRAEPFSLFTYDFSRIPSIMEERAGRLPGAVLPEPAAGGRHSRSADGAGDHPSTHRRGVERRSQRFAGGLSRGAPPAGLAPGREGAHRGDPHAVLAPLGVRPGAPGHGRGEGGGAEGAGHPELSGRQVASPSAPRRDGWRSPTTPA